MLSEGYCLACQVEGIEGSLSNLESLSAQSCSKGIVWHIKWKFTKSRLQSGGDFEFKMGKVSEWYRVAYQMEGLNEQSLVRGCSGVIKCKMEKLQKGIVWHIKWKVSTSRVSPVLFTLSKTSITRFSSTSSFSSSFNQNRWDFYSFLRMEIIRKHGDF